MTPEEQLQHRLMEEELARLRTAVEELSILNSLAQQIGALHSSAEIIETIVRRAIRAVGAEQGVITLVDRNGTDPMRTLVREITGRHPAALFHFHQSLLGWMLIHKQPLLVSDPATDARFQGVKWDSSIRSLLSAPLTVKAEVIAVLTVYNKKDVGGFTPGDQRLLSIIAAQSAQVVENARLYEEEKTLVRLRSEMDIAAEIQRDLLPRKAPRIPGYEILGHSIPAEQVGGDYFDYLPLEDGRLGLAIGDVSGKGMPAALYMAVCRGLLHALAGKHNEPHAAIADLNAIACKDSTSPVFITLFYSVLDPDTGILQYCSGGHNLPVLIRADGRVFALRRSDGMLVGIMPNIRYTSDSITLAPGDTLVLYTDGVTEAENPRRELFGERQLESVLTGCANLTADEIIQRVTSSVTDFVGAHPQSDDITVVVLRRLAE